MESPLAVLRRLFTERMGAKDDTSDEPGALGEMVARTLDQLRRHAGVVQFLHPHAREQVVAVGEPFELIASASAIRGLVADRVRFELALPGEEPSVVDECALEAGAAFGLHRCDTPGLYEWTWAALGPADVVVQRGPSCRVLVAGSDPVVFVDAALAFAEDPPRAALEALAEFASIAWIDFADEDHHEELRTRLGEADLPRQVILSHVHEDLDRSAFGERFHTAFLRTTCRRLRGLGVPLVGLVTRAHERFAACGDEGIARFDPADLLSDPTDARERLEAAARDFALRRSAADPLTFRLDETTRSRTREGNHLHVEFDNRQARRAILDAVDAAESSVDFQVYIVEDGGLVDTLGAALIRAARRGVRVRVLVDALYSREQAFGMRNPVLAALRDEPGVEVLAVDPVPVSSLFALSSLKKRDHRKLVILDGARAFVTGRNAGDLYYTGFDEVAITDATPYERIPWLDAHVEVRGPLVADIAAAFARAWGGAGGERAQQQRPEVPPAGPARARLVLHEAIDDANGMAAYEALLDAARSHVFILNDFPIVSTLVAAVRRALGRGVRVCLLTGNAQPRRGDGTFFRGPMYREFFEHMTKGRLEPLVRRGLELYEYATEAHPDIVCAGGVVRPYVHAKVMSVDRRALSVGSANLDATASFWEREANVVIEDETVAGTVEDWIERALARSFRVDPDGEYWQRDARARGVVARLWPESLYS